MSFLYRSTRGGAPELDFEGVTRAGLARDGGLYIPKLWPLYPAPVLSSWRELPYQEVAIRMMAPFVSPALDEVVLRALVAKSCAAFADPETVTPLRKLGEGLWLLELFHGPTLAFKDVALQLLGPLFEHFLEKSGGRMTVLGATSGDTGSAAMAALAGRKNIQAVILYPHGRPSEIQRRQMTCQEAPNVHAVAVEGSFDDCQALVKALFNDAATRERYHLAAVNSINWARILAQMVYYFVAALRLGAPDRAVSFVVPTGNFGNIYAAWAARRCGLPVNRLIVASNANDILPRFFETGRMEVAPVASTLSPSMDIQVSSNFERFLFDLVEGDTARLRSLMERMQAEGRFDVAPEELSRARQVFSAARVDDTETRASIRLFHDRYGVILDPHTAVGGAAALRFRGELPGPLVLLGCAHPAKFPDIIQGVTGVNPEPPPALSGLLRKPERLSIIPPEIEAVRGFLASRVGSDDGTANLT